MTRSGSGRAEPFFFGPAERRLYGCLHAPASACRGGVLLCPPIGHEAIQFHRALRELGGMLATAGFAVLRFDYRGCGDSAGGEEDWSLEAWQQDVVAGLDEVRRRSGGTWLAAVGLRLGATLVAIHGSLHGNLARTVLWDPVVDGALFLAEQRRGHEHMLQTAHVMAAPDGSRGGAEILGFGLPACFEERLSALSLGEVLDRPPSERVLLIESNPAASQVSFERRLEELGCEVRSERVANPHLWTWIEDFARVHVPHRILRSIVGWLSEEAG